MEDPLADKKKTFLLPNGSIVVLDMEGIFRVSVNVDCFSLARGRSPSEGNTFCLL